MLLEIVMRVFEFAFIVQGLSDAEFLSINSRNSVIAAVNSVLPYNYIVNTSATSGQDDG